MDDASKKTMYFSTVNIQTNLILSRLFSVSMFTGGLAYFIVQVLVNGDKTLSTISFCISIALMGLIPYAFIKIKASSNFTSALIGILNAFSFFYIAFKTMDSAALTAWGAAFVFIAASMLYVKRTALVLTGVGVIGTLIFVWIKTPYIVLSIDSYNHIGRISIVIVVFSLTLYGNHVFRKRLEDNLHQINEITVQKQELAALYEGIAATDERLQGQLSELIEAQKKINRLAYFDDLTGLTNRYFFMERVDAAIHEIENGCSRFAIMFIDLDNFKKINDLMGHQTGDEIIKKLAERLKNTLKYADTISRIGGDEFAVLLKGANCENTFLNRAEDILQIMAKPCTINGVTHYLSTSIGIAIYPDNGNTREELIMNVDTAMYKAKASGKNMYILFNDDIKFENDEKLKMEINLRNALKNEELKVDYQPLIDLETGEIRGFEALMRWNSYIHGMISPAKFIPALEEMGLIILYGEWILSTACRQNRLWHEKYKKDTIISVNISPIQFLDKGFAERVKEIVTESGLEPQFLELEITESILIDDFYHVVQKLKELKNLGVKISLDDFGTGYSSLNYLLHLPIDTLKIDRSFVADIKPDSPNRSIIGSIISLAHDMNFHVVAEGVESKEQMDYLTEKKCDYLQGYYFSKPVSPEMVDQLLQGKQ